MTKHLKDEEVIAEAAAIAETTLRIQQTQGRIKSILDNVDSWLTEINEFTKKLSLPKCSDLHFFNIKTMITAHELLKGNTVKGSTDGDYLLRLESIWKELNASNNSMIYYRAQLCAKAQVLKSAASLDEINTKRILSTKHHPNTD